MAEMKPPPMILSKYVRFVPIDKAPGGAFVEQGNLVYEPSNRRWWGGPGLDLE
jgi:hypothetical protein